MMVLSSQRKREKKTVEVMINFFCNNHHKQEAHLCVECHELFEYAIQRLEKCPFQEQKPTCFKCKIHCYEPSMRRKIRNVMKYSGPRMFFKQPSLALHHILDGFRKHN